MSIQILAIRCKSAVMSLATLFLFLQSKKHLRCTEILFIDLKENFPDLWNLRGKSKTIWACVALFVLLLVAYYALMAIFGDTFSAIRQLYKLGLPLLSHLGLIYMVFLLVVIAWNFDNLNRGLEMINGVFAL